MKYFFLLFWTFLQPGILSLHQGNFLQKNFGRISKKQSPLNNDLDDNKFLNKFYLEKEDVFKREIDVKTIATVAKNVKEMLDSESSPNLGGNVFYYPLTTEKPICTTPKYRNFPTYQDVKCESIPGKIICQLGKYNFVINNKNHNMERDVIEKFIVMAFHRYGEGDDCFDVAVDERDTTPCACYPPETTQVKTEVPISEQLPITIECNLVSNEKLKMCNPNYDPTEKIYQCKAKIIGLKKRSILNVVVDKYGGVAMAKDFIALYPKVRIKRELQWPQSEEAVLQKDLLILKSNSINNNFEQEDAGEENDLSSLYYRTKVPYVRNYTDICTMSYQFYPWCPEYKTYHPCVSTTADQYNISIRPCREAECTVPQSCITTQQCVEETSSLNSTLCTVEITTEEVYLKQSKNLAERKKRHRMNWQRMRRLQNLSKFESKNKGYNQYFDSRRSISSKRKERQFLAASGDSISSNAIPQNTSQSCPPCNNAQSTEISTSSMISISTATGTTAAASSPTQWCTITVPCNISTVCLVANNEVEQPISLQTLKANQNKRKMVGNFGRKLQGKSYINSQEQLEENNSVSKYSENNQQMQEQLEDVDLPPQTDRFLEEKFVHVPSYNTLQQPYSLLKNMEGYSNNLRYPSRNFVEGRFLRSLNTPSKNFIHEIKTYFRPKRKTFIRKMPRFRRKHMNRWQGKQIIDLDMHDEKI